LKVLSGLYQGKNKGNLCSPQIYLGVENEFAKQSQSLRSEFRVLHLVNAQNKQCISVYSCSFVVNSAKQSQFAPGIRATSSCSEKSYIDLAAGRAGENKPNSKPIKAGSEHS
jgi:hypothetical protein